MAASKSVSPAAASARLWVTILVGLMLGGSASARPPQAEQTRRRPNILVVLADDMGFSDAGCYGGEIQTPTLDELARNGLRFTQFYNTGRCWPSRASLLTGYYAQQVNRDPAGVRPPWARLLPEFLRPLGYRSYHSGKWHVDGKVLAGGFDRSYSIYDHDRNFGPRQHTLDDQPLPAVGPGQGYYSTTAIAEHAIDFLADHQKAHSDQPFFLYLAFIAPHFPLQAPAEDIAVYQDRYRAGWDAIRDERHGRLTKMGLVQCALSKLDPDIVPSWNLSPQELREKIGPGEVARAIPWKELTEEQQRFQAQKMSIHAAMIHRIDRETRRVLDQIRAMKAFDDTLVLFLSDNGASAEQIIRGDKHDPAAPPGSARSFLCLGPGWSSAANTPFRLHKSWVHEGGVSTPLIVHWPAGIKARGELRHTSGHLVDLLPTLLEITGGKPIETGESQTRPSLPGRSLLPAFASDVPIPHDFIFFQHAGNQGIRLGDFKLVSRGKNPWELYDLRSDRCEMVDLAVQSPEKVADLSSRWKALAEKYRLQGGPPPAKGEDHPDRR